MQPAFVTQLLTHAKETACSNHKQARECPAPPARPDRLDRASNASEIVLRQNWLKSFKGCNQPRKGNEDNSANTKNQRGQQPNELPSVGLVERQKERLSKPPKLAELIRQALQSPAPSSGCHGLILARSSLNLEARPANGHLSHEHEDEKQFVLP